MNYVDSIGSSVSTSSLRNSLDQSFSRRTADGNSSAVVEDAIEISDRAAALSRLADLGGARAIKIVDVQQAIQAGTYVTPAKLDAAMDGLLRDLSRLSEQA